MVNLSLNFNRIMQYNQEEQTARSVPQSREIAVDNGQNVNDSASIN